MDMKGRVAGMTAVAAVILALAAIIVVSAGATIVVARMLYKRIRRSRAVAGAALRTRAALSRGPQREVLGLRIRLRETLGSGQAAVDLALGSDGPRGELPRLFHRIQDEGAALDAQLVLLTSETDAVVLAEELPMARRRVDDVAGLVRRLRATVAGGRGDLTDDVLLALRSEVDREVSALEAGVQELHALNLHDHRDTTRGSES
ncbi:hypothetical protein E3O55_05485 [Cryobacterium sp. MDB1-18-2]|uniref:hypothetical protein n=2 Tax=unclassified Cryobacterium TaxID=2649013 RepID=UPI001103B2F3|nr:hypothetical protein [Cryobacterium sp. MDB1-18-2]TFC32350.1 hypothetical protein E3O55_05485 [Cryobacterium sp. MDB1-18-2]